jgi:hypothetical protein
MFAAILSSLIMENAGCNSKSWGNIKQYNYVFVTQNVFRNNNYMGGWDGWMGRVDGCEGSKFFSWKALFFTWVFCWHQYTDTDTDTARCSKRETCWHCGAGSL